MANNSNQDNTLKIVVLLTLTLVFLTITCLYFNSMLGHQSPPPPSLSTNIDHDHEEPMSTTMKTKIIKKIEMVSKNKHCDIFSGEWVPNPYAPYYNNETCKWAIHEHQNCMKFGRPDSEFMKWRWKPDDCNLPIFNPAQFLEIMRGKSMAFLGDSVGRNQMQSLICLLNRVTYTKDISLTPDEKFKRWFYPSHNFTLANFWSPYLVQAEEADPNGPTFTGLFNLHLDVPDTNWTSQIEQFDYVIVSAGHWFFRPTIYYENNHVQGCHYCLDNTITDLTMYYGYRMAFRTTFQELNRLPNFKGTVFLRTFAPSHFENGEWDKGGNCNRQKPFRSNETRLEGINLEMYMTQLEEFRDAEREGRKRGLKFRLLDMTEVMLMRPDGHPGSYGHLQDAKMKMYNDCVHWCLPGPIDTWNDFLLQMLKMEGERSASGRIPLTE